MARAVIRAPGDTCRCAHSGIALVAAREHRGCVAHRHDAFFLPPGRQARIALRGRALGSPRLQGNSDVLLLLPIDQPVTGLRQSQLSALPRERCRLERRRSVLLRPRICQKPAARARLCVGHNYPQWGTCAWVFLSLAVIANCSVLSTVAFSICLPSSSPFPMKFLPVAPTRVSVPS